MFIVISTAHAKSPDDAQKVCDAFHGDLTLRLSPGYLRGECATQVDDPAVVIIVQYWGTEAARDVRTVSADSRRVLAAVQPYLVAPAEAVVYEAR